MLKFSPISLDLKVLKVRCFGIFFFLVYQNTLFHLPMKYANIVALYFVHITNESPEPVIFL